MIKKIKGYEGSYEIYDDGRVFSCERLVRMCNQWNEYTRLFPRRLLKPVMNSNGYLSVTLCKDKIHKTYFIHQLMARHFIDKDERKTVINHKDGVKTNNHYLNLEWSTYSDNVKHAYRTGLIPSRAGELNHQAKLTRENVEKIRALYVMKEHTLPAMAKIFKVSLSTIKSIVYNKRWVQ